MGWWGWIKIPINYTLTKGKCGSCEEKKPLDEMVRKEGQKGKYHCIDCEVEKTGTEYNLFPDRVFATDYEKDNPGMVKKLLNWAFG